MQQPAHSRCLICAHFLPSFFPARSSVFSQVGSICEIFRARSCELFNPWHPLIKYITTYQAPGKANAGTALNLTRFFPAVPRSLVSEGLSLPPPPTLLGLRALPPLQQACKPHGTPLLWLAPHSPHSFRLLPPTTAFMELSHVQKHN